METDDTTIDVAVIGGGLAGLTAACYLARAGRRVTLFEQAPQLGGRAATEQSAGFAFNRGAHAFYPGGATSRVLHELGISYTYGTPDTLRVLQHGQLVPFPARLWTLLRSPLLSLRDRLALARVFATLPRLESRSLAGVSVQSWIECATTRPAVRQIVAALARPSVFTAALDLVSAEVVLDKWQRAQKHPVQYIDGGWQTLVTALRDQAAQAGAQIVADCGVASIEHVAGQIDGLRLRDGRRVPAAAVLIATTPRAALKLLNDGMYAPLQAVVEHLVPAYVACLDVALQRLPRPEAPVVQDLDRPCFLTAQSQYARVAPAGAALVHVFKQLDPRQPSAARVDEQDLEGLLDAAQPGWRDVLLRRSFLPRMEAVSVLPLASTGGFAGRPGLRLPGLRNGYLAGDWIGDEGFLVDASMASARAAAQALLHLPVQQPIGAGAHG